MNSQASARFSTGIRIISTGHRISRFDATLNCSYTAQRLSELEARYVGLACDLHDEQK